jgi:hypothetical protein
VHRPRPRFCYRNKEVRRVLVKRTEGLKNNEVGLLLLLPGRRLEFIGRDPEGPGLVVFLKLQLGVVFGLASGEIVWLLEAAVEVRESARGRLGGPELLAQSFDSVFG